MAPEKARVGQRHEIVGGIVWRWRSRKKGETRSNRDRKPIYPFVGEIRIPRSF